MAGGFEDTSYFVRSIKQIFDVTLAQFSPSNYCITSNRKIIFKSRIIKTLKIIYIIFFYIEIILITQTKNSPKILIFNLIILTLGHKF